MDKLYSVTFSNGYQTIIDWDGLNTRQLGVVWSIIGCWYTPNELEGVTITKIELE